MSLYRFIDTWKAMYGPRRLCRVLEVPESSYFGWNDQGRRLAGERAEVEAVLMELDDVLEAAVVGERDSAGILRPVAFVIPTPDVVGDVGMLETHCRERLAGFKRPRRFEFVDALPKTTTGKIQRFKLRDTEQR